MQKTSDIPWHARTVDAALLSLHVVRDRGLSDEEAAERRKTYGPNAIVRKKEWRTVMLFLSQIRNPLVIILLAAGVIAFLLGEVADTIIIFLAVAINTSVGMLQEGRASRAFDALRKTLSPKTRVLREGELKEIDARDLVPGDIIEVEAGMSIEADARIIEAQRFTANESTLTGEWIGQKKTSDPLAPHMPLADRANMMYRGTLAEEGRARALVVATGPSTEWGAIAEAVGADREPPTPFQKNIARLSRRIGIAVVFVTSFYFLLGILRGEHLETMFLTSVALAVSSVPEGLPIAITVILALGMERILKEGGLLKRLKSAETLGSTSIILTDKTGTLTEGKMEVAEVRPRISSAKERETLLLCGMLTSAAFIENREADLHEWKIRGGALDRALLAAGIQAGISREEFEKKHRRLDFFPFDTVLRFSAAVYKDAEGIAVFVTGAPEEILERSDLTQKERSELTRDFESITHNGIRVVACAVRRFPRLPSQDGALFTRLHFLGFIGFHDPLRSTAREALYRARSAGIRPVIVTGDHPLTAKSIAEGLAFDGEDDHITSGDEFVKGNLPVERFDIFARVLPAQKSLIAEAWQKKGAVVAMTGDGVNDAPALLRADIGIALASGTDVAKEAADLVLLDNSFNVVIAAIEEGRAIIDNIRKVITFLLSTSFAEITLIGGALLLGYPLPILPAQILWMNFVGEGFFNFAFAFEKKEHDVLTQKPNPRDRLFTREMKVLIFGVGLITSTLLFLLFLWLYTIIRMPIEMVRSIIFFGIAVDSFFFVFALRSLRRSIWNINFFSNPYLLFSFLASIAFVIPVFLLPPLQRLLHFVVPEPRYIVIVIILGLLDLFFVETVKYILIARNRLR